MSQAQCQALGEDGEQKETFLTHGTEGLVGMGEQSTNRGTDECITN